MPGRTSTCRSRRGTGDEPWLGAVDRIVDVVGGFGATALVVSLGVDAAAADPESPLQITHDGYESAGARLAALGLPTVAVQEGGYHLDTIGDLVAVTLRGLGGAQPERWESRS